MKRSLKILLKSSPVLIGLAHVFNGLEAKQAKKISFKRVLIGVLMGSLLIMLVAMVYVRVYYDTEFKGSIDGCAVVFGAAVWKDDQPSNALNDRTQAAIKLYKNNQVTCLVFSGGASKFGSHEVTVMGNLAREAGIFQPAVEYDFKGKNTLATLYNLAPNRDYVLVSNDFHLARINLMAKRVGLDNYHLHAAPYEYGRYNKSQQYYWREVAGSLIVWFGL